MTILGIEVSLFVSVCIALVGLSCLFNFWVGKIGERKRGYTALLVMVGVAMTLGGVALWDWRSALISAIAFIFSGVPMIIGDIDRHIREDQAVILEVTDATEE